jgi:hypothetical protein
MWELILKAIKTTLDKPEELRAMLKKILAVGAIAATYTKNKADDLFIKVGQWIVANDDLWALFIKVAPNLTEGDVKTYAALTEDSDMTTLVEAIAMKMDISHEDAREVLGKLVC